MLSDRRVEKIQLQPETLLRETVLCWHRYECFFIPTFQQPSSSLVCFLLLQQHISSYSRHHGHFAPVTHEHWNRSNMSLLAGGHFYCTQKLKAFRAETQITIYVQIIHEILMTTSKSRIWKKHLFNFQLFHISKSSMILTFEVNISNSDKGSTCFCCGNINVHMF